MSLNLNRLTIAGNLTRDIDLRYTTKGTPVGSGSIAVNRKWADADGQKLEEVTFVEFTCFGKTAENASRYTGKGLNVLIEGRLRLEQWEDKATGKPRQRLAVIADTVHFIQFKDDGEAGRQASPPARQAAPQRSAPNPEDAMLDGDDVPF